MKYLRKFWTFLVTLFTTRFITAPENYARKEYGVARANDFVEKVLTSKYKDEADRLKYFHMRSSDDPNLACTIGYYWNHEKQEVHYTAARCSHGDTFSKKIGRLICKGRYMKYGPSHTLVNINNREELYEQLYYLWHPDHDIPLNAFEME